MGIKFLQKCRRNKRLKLLLSQRKELQMSEEFQRTSRKSLLEMKSSSRPRRLPWPRPRLIEAPLESLLLPMLRNTQRSMPLLTRPSLMEREKLRRKETSSSKARQRLLS